VLSTLWIRFQGWIAAAAAFVLAVAGAMFFGWRKGREQVQAKVDEAQAEQKVNTANAIVNRNEIRQHVETEVSRLPSSPDPQPAASAPAPVPGSAADELRKNWSRD